MVSHKQPQNNGNLQPHPFVRLILTSCILFATLATTVRASFSVSGNIIPSTHTSTSASASASASSTAFGRSRSSALFVHFPSSDSNNARHTRTSYSYGYSSTSTSIPPSSPINGHGDRMIITRGGTAMNMKTNMNTDSDHSDTKTKNDKNIHIDIPIFQLISELAIQTLYQSDLKRDAKGKGRNAGAQGSSATNWIDDKSSFALKSAMDQMRITFPDAVDGLDRDEAISWIRWMKSSPMPLVINLTNDLKQASNNYKSFDEMLQALAGGGGGAGVRVAKSDFLSRISCKVILLPSGAEIRKPLLERTGTIVFGKLLYGGVSRYRLLGSSTSNRPPRRVGEKTSIWENNSDGGDGAPCWVQFGGTERKYQAVDMGAAAIFEISLSGKKEEPKLGNDGDDHDDSASATRTKGEMQLKRIDWSPMKMFSEQSRSFDGDGTRTPAANDADVLMGNSAMNLGGKNRNDAFTNEFKSSVGGLGDQIEVIVRRVLDGRVIRPVDEGSVFAGGDADSDANASAGDAETSLVEMTDGELYQAAMEADELALLGLTPVKGLLLYGPPGCGKTALAREISRALRARSPKILSAPELLDRWVGSSEKQIRQLFADAEAELAACNGDATKSALHVIVIDEIDAVFRRRTSAEDSGEATRSSAVNQILSKLDGVHAIPNVLVIGMTNRRELLDPALLRPGRLEVQILVPKPDTEGRREILNIHFGALRQKGRLSWPLCCAIDGVRYDGDREENADADPRSRLQSNIIDSESKPSGSTLRKRDKVAHAIRQAARGVSLQGRNFDLAAVTVGYSGADLAGLVRCAGSMALSRTRMTGSGIDGLYITLDDVQAAMKEVEL